jgi:hypothetical protein
VENFFTYLNFLLWKLSVPFMCKGLLIIREGLFQIRRDTGKWCLSAISSFLKDIYIYIYHIFLSIHPLLDTLTNSIIRQLQMVLQWTWRYLYSSLFSFFWIRVWDWYSQIIL